MAQTQTEISLPQLRNTLLKWLEHQLDEDALEWISSTVEDFNEGVEDWQFFSSFSAVPRYTGKDSLALTDNQQKKADQIRSGWKPEYWRVDQLGRTLLVLAAADSDKATFLDRLEKTFVSSDMGEAEALYQALPILPYPKDLAERGAEGIRSNMTSVFNAVALNNPYPADYFDEGAWNQMVLKALFVQSPLYKIQGIDRRRNAKLAEMLVDYAHERWAADRTVSPELWRPVGPYARGSVIDDLEKGLQHSDPLQQQAAYLALSESEDERAAALIEKHDEIGREIDNNDITWDDIGRDSAAYRE